MSTTMYKALRYPVVCMVLMLLVLPSAGCPTVLPDASDVARPKGDVGAAPMPFEAKCVEATFDYLRATMDRYHGQRYWVYDDADSAGNHFLVWHTFTNPGTEAYCPIVIHGDTSGRPPMGSASCVSDEEAAAHVDWRRYTTPADGVATFTVADAPFEPVLSVHETCPGTKLNELACGLGGPAASVTIPVEERSSYLIRIAGIGDGNGPYTLTIDGPPDPDGTATHNCEVSVEFDAFVTQIPHQEKPKPIYSGATAIGFRLNYTNENDFGGLVMNNGVFEPITEGGTLEPNYGTVPDAGVDLTGARALHFHARGARGGETVTFFVGGVGWDGNTRVAPHAGSTPAVSIVAHLSAAWREYTIPLEGHDLSHVIGGFGWSASAHGNPNGSSSDSDHALAFYVDEVYFELDEQTAERRLAESPRFLQSFTTRPVQNVAYPIVGDFDHRFRNVAFVYDNALALLAFLAEGSPDGLERAQLIGDAFVYAADHDRKFRDGRLRSAYAAGDLTLPPGWMPNGCDGEVRLAGFFNTRCQEYQELFTDNISVGNTAWAMIALLSLYERTGEGTYLDTAYALGEFLSQFRDDTCEDATGIRVGGFTGGLNFIEARLPVWERFSSAEHNIDVFAAYAHLNSFFEDECWLEEAEHAKRFVWSLWDEEIGCIYAGRGAVCETDAERGHLPLDVQAWAVLGIPGTVEAFPGVLDCPERFHATQSAGFLGFDFNDDRDGVWLEGTAHVATADAWAGDPGKVSTLRSELCSAQREALSDGERAELPAPFNGSIGLPAATENGTSTGFGFELYRRLHTGATAWNVFAQLGVNPYYIAPAPQASGQPTAALYRVPRRPSETAR